MTDPGALQQVADQYRQEGYAVTVRPNADELPGFLASFDPDLIAQKNGDQVVVQVRVKEDLRDDPSLGHLAGVVNAQAGWRFDVVVLNPRKWPDEIPDEAAEPGNPGIAALIGEAERLVGLQAPRAALLIAWAAGEAALRAAARREGIALERNDPGFVLDTLYSQGVLSRDQYDQLVQSLRLRNALMHGLQTATPDSMPLEQLLEMVKQILQGQPTSAAQ